jgi:hypothetical protein
MEEKKKTPTGSIFWQIVFPTLLGTLLLLLAAGMIVLKASPGNTSRFAEISTVLLVLPVMFSSILVMLLLGGAIALVLKVIHGLPSITGWILEKIELIQKIVTRISKSATVPIVRPATLMAGLGRIFSKGKPRVQID